MKSPVAIDTEECPLGTFLKRWPYDPAYTCGLYLYRAERAKKFGLGAPIKRLKLS
jgi:hypothetical protein